MNKVATKKEPIFLNSIYKEKVWGGNRIKDNFNKTIDNEKIGESLEVVSNKKEDSTIINGVYKNMKLSEIFINNKELFGQKMQKFNHFPLIVKYLDATDNLSVQLHPNAQIDETKAKEECWYVIDAVPDVKIIYGLKKNVTKHEFKEIIYKNKINEYLNYCDIKKATSYILILDWYMLY